MENKESVGIFKFLIWTLQIYPWKSINYLTDNECWSCDQITLIHCYSKPKKGIKILAC